MKKLSSVPFQTHEFPHSPEMTIKSNNAARPSPASRS